MAEDTQQQSKLLWSLHHMLWYTELIYATKDVFFLLILHFEKKKKNISDFIKATASLMRSVLERC